MPRKRKRRSPGDGCVYRRGATWSLKWVEGGRQRYQHGFETEGAAEVERRKIATRIAEGLPAAVEARQADRLGVLAKPWLDKRKTTHRAWRDDVSRWRVHLAPTFGGMRPGDVNEGTIRRFVEDKIAEGLNPATVRLCVRLLSSFYSDMVDDKVATTNPCKTLPRKTKRLTRSTADPRKTPYVKSKEAVASVFRALPAGQVATAYAVGALAGLRLGEIIGLDWQYVHLAGPSPSIEVVQQVSRGRLGPLKDSADSNEPASRSVPIFRSLAPVLEAWRAQTGGEGMVFKPTHPKRGGRSGRPATFIREAPLRDHLDAALEACKIPRMSWYQATRHTFASLAVAEGWGIDAVSRWLGHSSILVTKRYAHLDPKRHAPEVYGALEVDLLGTGTRSSARSYKSAPKKAKRSHNTDDKRP